MGAGGYAIEKSESDQLRKLGQISGYITHTKIFTILAIKCFKFNSLTNYLIPVYLKIEERSFRHLLKNPPPIILAPASYIEIRTVADNPFIPLLIIDTKKKIIY